ncbi:MAG TPA: RidA family protein [Candidatus Lustribacter sp.]|nr:RidA family protein [Candidatus Lustribacter sp.]
MLDATALLTADAPAPVGPYSQAIRVDGFVFCSGQVGLDPATGKLVDGGVVEQTRQVLKNLTAVLASADLTLADVVKTTIFLVDINDFAVVNGVYGERMGSPPPARSTVAVAALPLGARVEIEAIASAGA